MRQLRLALAVASKDLRSEIRSKETLNAAVSFTVAVLLLFSFAFDPSPDLVRDIGGGLLWLVFLFAGALVLNRSFARELPNDCMDALLTTQATPAAIFVGKCMASFTVLLLVEFLALPVFTLFYNIHWKGNWGWLLIVMALATWAIVVIGVTFAALTVNLRIRELMLPVLLYPMLIPPMMAAFHLTGLILAGEPIAGDQLLFVRLLVGFDVIFTSLALLVTDAILIS